MHRGTALCKLTAEMCLHLGKLTNPGEAAKNVFDRLIDYMPLVSLYVCILGLVGLHTELALNKLLFQPPVNEDGSVAPSPSLEFTKVENLSRSSGIISHFSSITIVKLKLILKVEALMFAFHRICRQVRSILKTF